MNKKSIFFATCIAVSLFTKAQITSFEYPSGYLSEEKISQILEKSRKNGIKEWEVQKQNEILHRQLKKQIEAVANGSFAQKTIQPPPQIATAGCNNSGFENGTVSGWTFMQGCSDGSSGVTLPCPACFTAAGGVYEVTSPYGNSNSNNNHGNNVGGNNSSVCDALDCSHEPYTNGIDHFGGFPVVAPLGGSHSLLINNSNAGYLMQQASQSFIVDASNTAFTFQYAAVLQDGSHTVDSSPYLDVRLTDVSTGAVIPCSSYSAVAANITGGTLYGWIASSVDNTVYYKPWTTVSLDLSSIIGHTVTMQFSVSDCNAGGHFGYAYIDASCNMSTQITSSKALCTSGDTTVLSGPAGYATYNWSGPVTGSAQNLKTGTPGSYTLSTTSFSGCWAPILYYNLTRGSYPTLGITATSTSVCAGAIDTLKASGAVTYTWSSNANSVTTSTASVTTNTNTTYTVTAADASGCVSTASINIATIASPTVNYTFMQDPAPYTWDVYPNYPSNMVSATWYWGDGTSSTALYPTHTYSVAASYSICVTVTDVNGCNGSFCQKDSVYRLSNNSTSSNILYVNIFNPATTGLSQLTNSSNQVLIYPNPATEMLYVECKVKNATLFINDVLGNKIKQLNVESELTSIDISSLSKGVYFLNIKTVDGLVTKKFVVQR